MNLKLASSTKSVVLQSFNQVCHVLGAQEIEIFGQPEIQSNRHKNYFGRWNSQNYEALIRRFLNNLFFSIGNISLQIISLVDSNEGLQPNLIVGKSFLLLLIVYIRLSNIFGDHLHNSSSIWTRTQFDFAENRPHSFLLPRCTFDLFIDFTQGHCFCSAGGG